MIVLNLHEIFVLLCNK